MLLHKTMVFPFGALLAQGMKRYISQIDGNQNTGGLP